MTEVGTIIVEAASIACFPFFRTFTAFRFVLIRGIRVFIFPEIVYSCRQKIEVQIHRVLLHLPQKLLRGIQRLEFFAAIKFRKFAQPLRQLRLFLHRVFFENFQDANLIG
jgi:hypothetical protein